MTLTATVTGDGMDDIPSGETVNFYNQSTAHDLGQPQLTWDPNNSDYTASLTTSTLSVGEPRSRVTYGGDGNYTGSPGTTDCWADQAPTTTIAASSQIPRCLASR